jgi:hypothetical protein
MRTHLGPLFKAFKALGSEGGKNLERDLLELIDRFNRSGGETITVLADYLETVATCRQKKKAETNASASF